VQREISRELGVECPVAQLFRYPTVRMLAAYLATLQPGDPTPAETAPTVVTPPPIEMPPPSRRDRRRAIRQQLNPLTERHDSIF
ncbi:MAG TPA: acyl carrier protein, partial [Candidatus Competibacteraceae bacterium]|nr:acyl carrier protein [Candidatus Competibacteraceae bacterium]